MKSQAIETLYKGYRFRSRLEARWAVYFDSIGLEWQYEPQGFVLDGDTYLPDFWLPQVAMWAEVKPQPFTDDELRKLRALAKHTCRRCLMLIGVPDCTTYDYLEHVGCDVFEEVDCVISMYHNYPREERRFYCSTGGVSDHDFSDVGMFDDVPVAVTAARSARFEHGECPL